MVSPLSDTMTIRIHYQTITGYRELPPKWKIIEPDASNHTADRYVRDVDQLLHDVQARVSPSTGSEAGDLVATVFGNQAITHELSSRHLADLIHERRGLAKRHLSDIRFRLDDLMERRPLRGRYGASSPQDAKAGSDVERQILELEKQIRDIQMTLWRDTLELRQTLLTERREYGDTRRRMSYLNWSAPGQFPAAYTDASEGDHDTF